MSVSSNVKMGSGATATTSTPTVTTSSRHSDEDAKTSVKVGTSKIAERQPSRPWIQPAVLHMENPC